MFLFGQDIAGNVSRAAGQVARRSASFAAASILCAVGIGFLTVAAWIGLEHAGGALMAASVIGSVYMGVGLIVLALAMRRRPAPPPAPPAVAMPQLTEAFLLGLTAAIKARQS